MNTKINQKGFTIVELLIVVVVIAILAAISIVAYTGITNRANRSAAMEAANAVKSVATTFSGTNGAYPTTRQQFINGHSGNANNAIAKMPSDIEFKNGLPVASDDPEVVAVQKRGSTTAPTGFIIHYWDYVDGAVRTMEVGEGTAISTTTTNAFVQ